MEEREFNLLDEPWIKVLRPDLQVDTLSLQDVMLHAQEYIDLGGENALQNFAVLRLLIAVAYTIFSRVDENGEKDDLATIDDLEDARDAAIDRWSALWKNEKFPEKPVLDYFKEHHDEFWLFDPERPFGQVPNLKGTAYKSCKLIGDISEGENKLRIFSNRSGKEKEYVSYSEAARWLLFINAFDDTSGKKSKESREAGKKLNSVGVSWVGQLGMIETVGKNLFETILLNMPLLEDGEESWPGKASPNWEHMPKADERSEIPAPDNLASILTLQSRRLLLQRKNGRVTGFLLLGGDYFSNVGENGAFCEQMTIWGIKKKKHSPQKFHAGREMWRDFGNCFVSSNGSKLNLHLPGIVSWYKLLQNENVIDDTKPVQFRTFAIEYTKPNPSAIMNLSSDFLTFYPILVSNKEWAIQEEIKNQISKCGEVAKGLNQLMARIYIASGGDIEKEKKLDDGEIMYYQAIDEPFRLWLLEFHGAILQDPDAVQNLYKKWENTSKTIAYQIAELIERKADLLAYKGRKIIIDKKNNISKFFSVPIADFKFNQKLHTIYPKVGDDK